MLSTTNRHGQQVINFIELFILKGHLPVDAIDMLRTSGNFSDDFHIAELILHIVDDFFQILFPLCTFLLHQIDDAVILLRI